MDNIGDILEAKGHKVWTIAPDARLYDALVMMAENRVGALVVVEEHRVVGILSERDYTFKVDICGHTCQTSNVRDVMSKEVYCVTPETSIDEAMALVTESRCRHLPVLENEKLVGLASIGDLVKAVIEEKEFVITQLSKYIKGEL